MGTTHTVRRCTREFVHTFNGYSNTDGVRMVSAVPIIEEKFAVKIAQIYVNIYRKDGFRAATDYLDMMTGGDEDLRNIIVPLIVQLGEKK